MIMRLFLSRWKQKLQSFVRQSFAGQSFAGQSFTGQSFAGQSRSAELLWWVEVHTAVPLCTYYFGPFDSRQEAQKERGGYIEDLHREEARDIVALVKRCREPESLTIDHGYYSSGV
jgi:4-aminobutyrate aminotransferase-like enzyme